jgi:hypothetical protein
MSRKSPCAKISKFCISYPTKNELDCFSNFLHSESAVAKILPPYILQIDQFHCMEAKCIFKPPSAKIPNLVLNMILTTRHAIQVLHNSTYLYDQNGRHLHTIPLTRLQWLWDQYNHFISHLPTIEPPLQSFEIEIIWLIYRYKYPKNTQYALPNNMLDHLTTSFNITHSYFSSPITCSTLLKKFYSPFPCDCIFGSIGNASSH